MITTEIDNVEDILTILEDTSGDNPSALGNNLSSSEYNSNMNIVELRLNILYEKIRYLQELNAYIENYTKNMISEKIKDFQEKLRIISESTDLYRDNNSIASTIYFTANTETIKDRDGSTINAMTISDKKLVPPGNIISRNRINNISSKSSIQKYSSNYSNIINGSPGTNVYISDNILSGGLTEKVIIDIDNATQVNYINIPVNNAEIDKYEIVYTNDTVKEITPADKYIDLSSVKQIILTLKSFNYNKIFQNISYENTGNIFSESNVSSDTILNTENNMVSSNNSDEVKNI